MTWRIFMGTFSRYGDPGQLICAARELKAGIMSPKRRQRLSYASDGRFFRGYAAWTLRDY
jgi:hypothetical protein